MYLTRQSNNEGSYNKNLIFLNRQSYLFRIFLNYCNRSLHHKRFGLLFTQHKLFIVPVKFWLFQQKFNFPNKHLVGTTQSFCRLDTNQTFYCLNQTVSSVCIWSVLYSISVSIIWIKKIVIFLSIHVTVTGKCRGMYVDGMKPQP